METRELERIRRLLPRHPELASLWDEHMRLEGELEELSQLRTLTPQESARRSELKKRKLVGRDRIQNILDREA